MRSSTLISLVSPSSYFPSLLYPPSQQSQTPNGQTQRLTQKSLSSPCSSRPPPSPPPSRPRPKRWKRARTTASMATAARPSTRSARRASALDVPAFERSEKGGRGETYKRGGLSMSGLHNVEIRDEVVIAPSWTLGI